MKRRNFLRHAVASGLALPVWLDGYGARAFGRESGLMRVLAELAASTDRVLVLIQLQGGNDGLNTVIPLDQMGPYMALRSNIAIAEAKALRLSNNIATGLHPAMTGLQSLYNDGLLSIVHGASYPSPSFSHFRASDIWFTGEDASQTLTTGWAGRYLNNKYPGYPDKYPSADMPDPLAIQISAIASTALLGPKESMGITFQNPDTFAQLVGDKPTIVDPNLPNTPAGRNVAFIRQAQVSSVQYAGQIQKAAGKAKNLGTYPASNTLADQLKIVARLIAGGLQTKVYYVQTGGFDTHANQTDAADTSLGYHANLLRGIASAIKAFQDDLKALRVDDRVAGMTFSEFGRRAGSNASRGTDHGAAAPMFVFGNGVRQQNIGKNPNLSDLDNGNIKMQTDFRQVYSALIADWLGEGQAAATAVLSRAFEPVPIFQSPKKTDVPVAPELAALRVYPNPATDNVLIESAGVQSVQLVNPSGRTINVPISQIDDRTLSLNVRNLPAGTYFVDVQTGTRRLTNRLVVAH